MSERKRKTAETDGSKRKKKPRTSDESDVKLSEVPSGI